MGRKFVIPSVGLITVSVVAVFVAVRLFTTDQRLEKLSEQIKTEKWTRDRVIAEVKKFEGAYVESTDKKVYVILDTTRPVLVFIDWKYADSIQVTFGPDQRVTDSKYETMAFSL